MSRIGKILWIVFALSFLSLMGARIVLGGWNDYLWIPLGFTVLSFIGAMYKDMRFYKELFFMRTTKHGMNLGAVVLLVLVTLIGVNFISYRHNFKKDVTSEKLNSLSDQSLKLLNGLQDELKVTGFFLENTPEMEAQKSRFEQLIGLYKTDSSKVNVQFINPNKRPDLVEKYKITVSGEVILEYKGKQNRIRELTEQDITNAILKLTRDKNKVIYILTGHGEKDVDSGEPTGAANFKKSLADASYEVRTYNLIEKQKIPEDASLVMVLGPSLPYLKPEIEAISEYMKKGGRLYLAADPGMKHNIADVMRQYGVDFTNQYVVDPVGQLVGASAAMAIGLGYSPSHEITRKFGKNMMTGFPLAGALKKGSDTSIQTEEIVMSSPASFTQKEISQKVKFNEKTDQKGPLPLVMFAKETKENGWNAVFFGDSDFMTNQVLDMQLNRDLALNTAAFLSKDSDLISLRPKTSKNTPLLMTDTQKSIYFVGLVLPIPFLLFGAAGVLWFRRRGA